MSGSGITGLVRLDEVRCVSRGEVKLLGEKQVYCRASRRGKAAARRSSSKCVKMEAF